MRKPQNSKDSKDWWIGETVWEWLCRHLNLEDKGAKKKLIDNECKCNECKYIDRTTLYRFKREGSRYIARENIRNNLAKFPYTDTTNLKRKLGLFGYPSRLHLLIDIKPEVENSKPKPTATDLNDLIKNLDEDETKSLKRAEQRLQTLKQDDFWFIADQCSITEGICFFDKKCKQFDRKLKDAKEVNGRALYLGTHSQKLFGCIQNQKSKYFEYEVFVCEQCIRQSAEFFTKDIALLLQETCQEYNKKQTSIADELEVSQAYISKLCQGKTSFLKPELLKSICKLWINGTLTDVSPLGDIYQDYMRVIVRHRIGETHEKKFLEEMDLKEEMENQLDLYGFNDFFDVQGSLSEGDEFSRAINGEIDRKITNISLTYYNFDMNAIWLDLTIDGSIETNSGEPYNNSAGYPVSRNICYTVVDLENHWISEVEFSP
jgi:transcriptional regulator with XRE-family HTH domain